MKIEEKRKAIQRFMQYKAEVFGFPSYFTQEDCEELERWPESSISSVFKNLNQVSECNNVDDSDWCPWCILHIRNYCKGCGYKKRHGVCSELDSTYDELLKYLNADSFVEWFKDHNKSFNELWKLAKEEKIN